MEEEATRICRVCGEEKPLDEFRLGSDTGKQRTDCKECESKKQKKWRDANKERVVQTYKVWREAHKEELSKKQLEWQRNNREKCRAYNKKSSQNMTEERKDKARARSKRYRDARKDDPEYIEYKKLKNRESTKRRRKKSQPMKRIARRLTLFLN